MIAINTKAGRLEMQGTAKLIGGAIVAGVLLSWIFGVKNIAKTTAKGAVGLAVGTSTGIVTGIGEAVGVPETNLSQCEQDLAAGRRWDASFSCPASKFLHSFFD